MDRSAIGRMAPYAMGEGEGAMVIDGPHPLRFLNCGLVTAWKRGPAAPLIRRRGIRAPRAARATCMPWRGVSR
jgi:hypothetical protein